MSIGKKSLEHRGWDLLLVLLGILHFALYNFEHPRPTPLAAQQS
jgi:hypothetical protein